MRSFFRFFIDLIFVFAVIFIWLMLIYQYVLTLGGFFYRLKLKKESRRVKGQGNLPSVSILIPARNEEKVIRNLLQRLQSLNYPEDKMEIIVINDGSTDGTESIVQGIAKDDFRIKLLTLPFSEYGKGKAAVLNRGLQKASHEVIAVYDADNIPENDSLLLLCRRLVSDNKLAAVTGKFRAFNRNTNLLTRFINIESVAFQWIIQAGRWFFLKVAFISGTNFVIWKNILKRIGGWDEQALTEDSELTFRIYNEKFLVGFLPVAVSWEQEPENFSTWIRQRTRWARGNNYIISKHGHQLFKKRLSFFYLELVNLLFLYYLFLFAIIFSDVLFIFSALNIVEIRVIGPYTELWALAFFLFVFEIILALSFEKEDSWKNILLVLLTYFSYTKLWAFVVLRSFYQDIVRKKARIWVKTERFDIKENDIKETKEWIERRWVLKKKKED
ncbi:MAG: glycosyltransferase family 2 protein [Candidatus Aminicenantes bacterium]|nr:glycosyltransferase family 2 protein [Candidatus Aminicenantes bacterium]